MALPPIAPVWPRSAPPRPPTGCCAFPSPS